MSSALHDPYNLGQALSAYRVIYEGLKQRYDEEYQGLDDECTAIDTWKNKWTRKALQLTPERVSKLSGPDSALTTSTVIDTMQRMESAKSRALALMTAMKKGVAFFVQRPIPTFEVALNKEETDAWQEELQEKESTIQIVYENMVHRIPLAQFEANKVYDCVTQGASSAVVNYARYWTGAKAYEQGAGAGSKQKAGPSDGKEAEEESDAVPIASPADGDDPVLVELADADDSQSKTDGTGPEEEHEAGDSTDDTQTDPGEAKAGVSSAPAGSKTDNAVSATKTDSHHVQASAAVKKQRHRRKKKHTLTDAV